LSSTVPERGTDWASKLPTSVQLSFPHQSIQIPTAKRFEHKKPTWKILVTTGPAVLERVEKKHRLSDETPWDKRLGKVWDVVHPRKLTARYPK